MVMEKVYAVITGGTKGLGRKFASNLLTRGASVIIADVDKKAGLEFEEKVSEACGEKRLRFLECNLADTQDIHEAFDFSKKYFGRLDVVCNYSDYSNFVSDDGTLDVTKQISTQLTAPIEGTYKGIDLMSIKNGEGGGVIINVSSSSAYNAFKNSSIYTATKFGIVGFSRSFKFLPYAAEHGVRVNCVCPFLLDPKFLKDDILSSSQLSSHLTHIEYSDMDDISKAMMMCVMDKRLNGEVIAAHAPPPHYKLF